MRARAWAAAIAAALALCACSPSGEDAGKPAEAGAPAPATGTLEWAASGDWRIEPERDQWRKPVETLRFFGLEPNMAVMEVFPGRGWYTAVIAPYLAQGGGRLSIAQLEQTPEAPARAELAETFSVAFAAQPEVFGPISTATLSPTSPPLGPDASLDMVLVFRNVHTLMAEGYAEKAFRDFYRVLKPGGVLGIEQHRGRSTGVQDPQANDGYVQEAYVRVLAAEAGFQFEEASELNANPKDTKDHPFGVWTLPPVLRSSKLGDPPDPRFDASPYLAIGESDRMTLRFRKPADASPAPVSAPPPSP